MSEESKKKVKKIGLIGCIATGIGAIIGSGIFGSLPTVINSIGPACVWALIAAAIYIIACMIPNMYATSAIPVSGSYFLYPAKLIHPAAGFFMAIQNLMQPVLISVFAVLFADYFIALFPALKGKEVLVSVVILALYTILAWFGNHTIVSVNNLMVFTLLLAIAMYIFVGLPNLHPDQITFGQVLKPAMNLTSFSAAIGILSSSLSGAGSVSQIANDIKNPRRNIPLTLILAPSIVCVIYVLMAVVTLGAMPQGELTTLSEVGKEFLSPALVTFFIVGGPLFGVLTSMVPVILLTVAQIEAAADNEVFPTFLAKRNKYNVSYYILFFTMAFAIIVSATGATFGVLMTVFSFVNTLSDLPIALIPFFIYKRYPHACAHAGLKINRGLAYVAAVFSFVVSIFLAYQMLLTLDKIIWALIGGATVAAIIYFIIRINYMKKNGRDLIADLKAPYPEWEAREEECRKMDETGAKDVIEE